MAPVKRRANTRSHHKMKARRRNPNISRLVYKFLSLGNGGIGEHATHGYNDKCRFCERRKRREEVLHLSNSQSAAGKSMANKRKDSGKNSKLRRVKRRQTSKDQTLSSCMHNCKGGEGVKKMRRYIQKALDFGVESGYLIPKDAAYRVLRVSSDLMSDGNYMSKARNMDGSVSRKGEKTSNQTPIRFEDYEVQDARKRRRRARRRRRRSRSRSRGRRRRRRGSRRRRRDGADEEVVENDDEDEYEDQSEKRNTTENPSRNEAKARKNSTEGNDENESAKREEDGTDFSMEEDDTDDDERKKGEDGNKS